jgi:hypothetical protein
MDAKAEFTKVLKDVQASAKEFAALSLNASHRALEFAGTHIKKAQERLKAEAEKLQPEKKDEPKKD